MSRTKEEELIKGRGASWNPENRFDGGRRYVVEEDVEGWQWEEEKPDPRTVYLEDLSKSVITNTDSPDLGVMRHVNPYRGCEHGCIYCYARPTHENFGLSAGLDFETKIFVKHRAAELLRAELSKKSYTPATISISGNTDAYQPAERRFQITRQCLEVLREFRHPVGIVTKNRLVTRDIDLLGELAALDAAVVYVSITTLDLAVNRILEPRSSAPAQRLEALRQLSAAGIPCGVMMAPVVPGITDHEMTKLLEAARDAGATRAGYILMRLPHAVAPLFVQWLEQHYPDRKDKVIHRIQELRGGRLNDPRFGTRMKGEGIWAAQFQKMFEISKRKFGLEQKRPSLSTAHFRRPGGEQMMLV